MTKQHTGKTYKEQSETVERLERELDAVFNSGFAMALIDSDHRFIRANRMFCRMFSCKQGDISGKRCSDLLKFDICSGPDCPLRQIKQGEKEFEREIRNYPVGQQRISFIYSAKPYKVTGKNEAGIIVSFMEITKRIEAEEALAESESMLTAINMASPLGIGLVRNRKIIWANEAFFSMMKLKSGDLSGCRYMKHYLSGDEDEVVERDLFPIIDEISYGQFETKLKRIDGSLLDCMIFTYTVDFNNPDKGRILAIMDISDLKKTEKELLQSRENIRKLARHNELAREEERKHIAREIHDELGHVFTALKIDIKLLSDQLPIEKPELVDSSQKMIRLIDETIPKVRSISSRLRPSVLDHFGLIAAIEWQADDFRKRTGIECSLEISDKEINPDSETSTAVFRIFQESLTNVARHANAGLVAAEFGKQGENLYMKVIDNGEGINSDNVDVSNSFGMMGMHERAGAVGGKLAIEGVPGVGTTVTLSVPLNQSKHA